MARTSTALRHTTRSCPIQTADVCSRSCTPPHKGDLGSSTLLLMMGVLMIVIFPIREIVCWVLLPVHTRRSRVDVRENHGTQGSVIRITPGWVIDRPVIRITPGWVIDRYSTPIGHLHIWRRRQDTNLCA